MDVEFCGKTLLVSLLIIVLSDLTSSQAVNPCVGKLYTKIYCAYLSFSIYIDWATIYDDHDICYSTEASTM